MPNGQPPRKVFVRLNEVGDIIVGQAPSVEAPLLHPQQGEVVAEYALVNYGKVGKTRKINWEGGGSTATIRHPKKEK